MTSEGALEQRLARDEQVDPRRLRRHRNEPRAAEGDRERAHSAQRKHDYRADCQGGAAVDPGAHAVLIVDQAGWHLTPKLAIPDNITVLALPPRSPELNPVENVWQFMRDNWLSNRIFKSYEDIVALCCQAWNNLIDQPWKIMSLGMRKWAHGF